MGDGDGVVLMGELGSCRWGGDGDGDGIGCLVLVLVCVCESVGYLMYACWSTENGVEWVVWVDCMLTGCRGKQCALRGELA